MDDEECLPENGNLKMYLQSLGFNDLQLKKSGPRRTNTIVLDSQPQKDEKSNADIIDEDIIRQIGILISTQMLFEEDVKNIENLLSNFKIEKHGMLKNMFQGTFGIIVVFFGMLLYLIIGSYIVFICSSLYAYKAADYLWRRNFSQRRLKKLASILHSNYTLLSKTIKFIDENDKFIQFHSVNNNEPLNELETGFDYYHSFKSDFYSSLNEIILVLTNSTKKLISNFPLYEYVENPKYYICNNVSELSMQHDLSKLYQIYLLVQSEFLQRFILSLIPNLNVNEINNFQVLNKILTESCLNLLKIKNSLNKKFKFVFFNGVHSPKSSLNSHSFITPKVYLSTYHQELASSIHDVSNTFQNLLIKSRTLENHLKLNQVSADMENQLINLQTELNFCQRNISDGFILLKKASGLKEQTVRQIKVNTDVIQLQENPDPAEKEKVPVGYTNLDPAIEDEIFEAYLGDENSVRDYSKWEDWNFEDLLKQKLQKEYSKNVMMELKTKLIEKAKLREKKETELLSKKLKGKPTVWGKEPEPVQRESDDGTPGSSFNDDDRVENNMSPEFRSRNENFFVEESANRKSPSSVITLEANRSERDANGGDTADFHSGFVDKSFLMDIGAARQRILQKSLIEDEQCFCDSDSDNIEEEILQE